jgi:hypothetical protein
MINQIQQPNDVAAKPDYEPPMVRMMNEAEVLSAFQVTAAGTATWWAM